MRLFEIARAIEATGHAPIGEGAELLSIHLVIPVDEEPPRDLRKFWRTKISKPRGRFRRWLNRLLKSPPESRFRQVRVSWEAGKVSGALLPLSAQRKSH